VQRKGWGAVDGEGGGKLHKVTGATGAGAKAPRSAAVGVSRGSDCCCRS